MPAKTAARVQAECPLCGSADGVASSERKRRLRMQFRSLENGGVHIREFCSQLDQMCAPCRMLMIGIHSDDDRLELRERIQKELDPVVMEAHHTAIPGETARGIRPDKECLGSRRDPEERSASEGDETREKMLDKTLADSFPTSDPPSSIPDPAADDSMAA